jgi:helicase
VDEAHLLGEGKRGATLEGALTRLRAINPMVQLVLISATLGNGPELASWLSGTFHQTHERPCPLTWETVRFKKAADKTVLAERACRETVEAGGQALIFVQSRRRAEDLARTLREDYGLAAGHHHAGLTRAQRDAVEGDFRAGTLAVICSTPTLAAGINLPCRLVILFDSQRYVGASTYEDLSCVEVWQRAGRAGRPGLDTEGRCIVMQPSWVRRIPNYEAGTFEPVRSALYERRFAAEQVLVAVSAGYARNETQVARLLGTSLGARQGRLADVARLVATMREAGMLETDEDGCLYATRAGHIAARHMLAPESVLAIKRFFDGVASPTTVDVLTVCCGLPGSDFAIYANRDGAGEGGRDPATLLAGVPSALVGDPALLRTLGLVGKTLNDALVRAGVLMAWATTGAAAEAGASTGCSESDVLGLRQEVLRVLQATQGLCEKTRPQQARVVSLAYAMVAAGMDGPGAYLALIPGVGPILARRLLAHGITSIEDLAQVDPNRLAQMPGVALERALSWRFAAEHLLENDTLLCSDKHAEDAPALFWTDDMLGAKSDYRDVRARELTVVAMGEGVFSVSGGSEPHRVVALEAAFRCDCADFAAGHRCKQF